MPRPFSRIRLPFFRCLEMTSTMSASMALVCAFFMPWLSARAIARWRSVTVSTLAAFLTGAIRGIDASTFCMCCPLLLLALTNRQKWIDIAAIFLFGEFGYRILERALANVTNVVLLPRSVQVGRQAHGPGRSFACSAGEPRTRLLHIVRRTSCDALSQAVSWRRRIRRQAGIFLLQSLLNRSI